MTLTRKKPIARKAAKKRRRLAGCPIRGCRRAPHRRDEAADLCRPHLVAAIDIAARQRKRTEQTECQDRTAHMCVGGLQWAHRASRRFFATRWADDGAEMICAGRHTFYTNNSDAWALRNMRVMGAKKYQAFLERARGPHPDLVAEYERLMLNP